jgi:hypothetical protein
MARRFSRVRHALGVKPDLLAHRAAKARPFHAVKAIELERDVLQFIAERYAGRHLDIETAQLGLSNAVHKLIIAHLKSVA